MNYPDILKIEITNHCNANCIFCNNNKIQEKQDMPLWMFNKVIKAFSFAKQVQPQWFGEPMTHPEFDGIIRICKKTNMQVVFYTNASLIAENFEALKRLDKKDIIIISLEGADKQTYEGIRKGLKWNKLLQNIELLQRLPVKKVIRMTVCDENKTTIINDIKFWKKKTGWKVAIINEKPLLEERKKPGHYINRVCKQPTNNFTISVDGKVKLCCIDYKSQVDLGQVTKDTDIKKLWKGTKNLRHCHYDICKECLFKFEEI